MNSEMNILDVVFILLLFFSVLFGIIRGLVREILSLAFLIAALVMAFVYYQEVGRIFNELLKDRDLANFVGFLLVLLLVTGVGSLLTHLLSKYLVIGPLKALDRILGAVFGLIRGVLLAGLVIYSFLAFPLKQELLNQSQLVPHLTRVIVMGMKILPPAVKSKLKLIIIYDKQKDSRNRRTV